MHTTAHALCALALALLAGAVQADGGPRDTPWPAPVQDSALDGLRGGFEAGGLRVSFGLERATYVNGQLVASSSFQLPDLQRVTPEQARQAATALGGLQWVRDGQARLADGAGSTGGTVIQNTLDNQALRQLTTLNIATNALGGLKMLNTLGSLRDALSAPLGGR